MNKIIPYQDRATGAWGCLVIITKKSRSEPIYANHKLAEEFAIRALNDLGYPSNEIEIKEPEWL